MTKDFKKFTAYDELHGSVLTTTSLYEFTDTEMQEHDERIRKEERAKAKIEILRVGKELLYYNDNQLHWMEEIFAQLEKEL